MIVHQGVSYLEVRPGHQTYAHSGRLPQHRTSISRCTGSHGTLFGFFQRKGAVNRGVAGFLFSEDRRFDVLRVDIKTTERNPTLQLGRAPKAWMSHTVVHVLFWQAFQQQRSIERLVFFGFDVRVRVTQVGLRDVFGKFCWTLLSVHHRPRSGGATGFADLG